MGNSKSKIAITSAETAPGQNSFSSDCQSNIFFVLNTAQNKPVWLVKLYKEIAPGVSVNMERALPLLSKEADKMLPDDKREALKALDDLIPQLKTILGSSKLAHNRLAIATLLQYFQRIQQKSGDKKAPQQPPLQMTTVQVATPREPACSKPPENNSFHSQENELRSLRADLSVNRIDRESTASDTESTGSNSQEMLRSGDFGHPVAITQDSSARKTTWHYQAATTNAGIFRRRPPTPRPSTTAPPARPNCNNVTSRLLK